jgi:uncharacterized protein YndB with AHSA1/START domain/mannose-6-phosphate isomerase-like protein (cupin superfamily)
MTQAKNQDLGTLVKLAGKDAVRYERVYAHAPDRVWRALVEPDSIKAWFPTSIEGLRDAVAEKRVGAKLKFVFPEDDGPPLAGELKVCEPPRVLEYTWGEDLLRFELSDAGSGKQCKLVFTTTFGERSQAPRDATGWHFCLDNLGRNLEGEKPEPVGAAFTEMSARYQEQLGGDFPKILKGASADDLARVLPAKHLEGQVFKADNDAEVVLVRATRATDVEHRDLPKGGYLAVIEGAFELHIGGHQMKLSAGMEFHIPEGAHVRGRMEEGTRVVLAAPAA